YGQALFDVALITTVVHITGGPQSDLTPLYVPLIAVTAVLMPPASTGLITALVGIVYFADVFFGHTTPMTGQVALQLLVFVGVVGAASQDAAKLVDRTDSYPLGEPPLRAERVAAVAELSAGLEENENVPRRAASSLRNAPSRPEVVTALLNGLQDANEDVRS